MRSTPEATARQCRVPATEIPREHLLESRGWYTPLYEHRPCGTLPRPRDLSTVARGASLTLSHL
jgi:hypothetical protein